MKRFFPLFIICLVSLFLNACGTDQIGGRFQDSFSVTPRCAVTDKILNFINTSGETIFIQGIGFSAGTNGAGNFSIKGIQVGSAPEIAAVSGGIVDIEVPPETLYKLRVRYSPLQESGDSLHSSILEIAYAQPAGIVQIELFGKSQGEADCPEVEEGGPVGLDGPVIVRILGIRAASPQIQDVLSSDKGVTDFEPVDLEVTLNADTGTIEFPQITEADGFIMPIPNKTDPANQALKNLVFTETTITTTGSVTGTFDPDTGSIVLDDLTILMENAESNLELVIPTLTTGGAPIDVHNDRVLFPPSTITSAGFAFDGSQMLGSPIGEDGGMLLVGVPFVEVALGKLSSAGGQPMGVQIDAQIICTDETTSCDFGSSEATE